MKCVGGKDVAQSKTQKGNVAVIEARAQMSGGRRRPGEICAVWKDVERGRRSLITARDVGERGERGCKEEEG